MVGRCSNGRSSPSEACSQLMAEVIPSSVSFVVQWGVASLALWDCGGWIPCQLFLIDKYIGYRFPTDSKLWARTWGILELDWDGKPTLNMSNAIAGLRGSLQINEKASWAPTFISLLFFSQVQWWTVASHVRQTHPSLLTLLLSGVLFQC